MDKATIVRELKGYPMSRDYARLWELAQSQSAVCVVDWNGGVFGKRLKPIRHIAQTVFDGTNVMVAARGICYATSIAAVPREDGAVVFWKKCEAVNLEWIVPEGHERDRVIEIEGGPM